jgi:hypothetical protein
MNLSYDPQTELRYRMAEVRTPHAADPDVVSRLPTVRAALRHAINVSGFDQEAIADALRIDPACFCRMVREPRTNSRPRAFPLEKLADFARVTGSLVVNQWLDMQMGMEPVALRETRVQRLQRELAEALQVAA